MKHLDFSPDYAILPPSFCADAVVTNPAELLRTGSWQNLLRLCGTEEKKIGAGASDYDFFCAVCEASELLIGHPTVSMTQTFLQVNFEVTETLSPANCNRIWRACCEDLFHNRRIYSDFLCRGRGATLGRTLAPQEELPCGTEMMLDGNLFLAREVLTGETWLDTVRDSTERFFAAGGKKIHFVPEEDFCFLTPDLYHVRQYLNKPKRQREEQQMLIAQLFRILCEQCVGHGADLVLNSQASATALCDLLAYAQETVGLPRIYWSTPNLQAASRVLNFQSERSLSNLYLTLRLSDSPSDAELVSVLSAYAARYPLGRLCAVTESDWIFLSFARQRMYNAYADVCERLRKSCEKK